MPVSRVVYLNTHIRFCIHHEVYSNRGLIAADIQGIELNSLQSHDDL